MAKSHQQKQFTQMAGEFGVVSELFRREIQATLTYGNSKSADVFVISKKGNRATKVEVKSTVEKKWILGDQALAAEPHVVWVFVQLPPPSAAISAAQIGEVGKSAPRYHVLTSAEVKALYEEKKLGGGTPITVDYGEMQQYLNCWEKIRIALTAI